MGMTVMAATAVVGVGYGIYSGERAYNDMRDAMSSSSPPANYYQYDSDGNLVMSQVWDEEKNAYISRAGPKTESEKEEEALRDEIRQRMLNNLNETPEDRVKAYEEYAQNLSDSLNKDVDKRYDETVSAAEENINARGMTGSKYQADLMSKYMGEKLDVEADIALQSQMAKETLKNVDTTNWMNLLGYLDAGGRADEALALEKAGQAGSQALAGTENLFKKYYLDTDSTLRKWEQDTERYGAMSNASSSLLQAYMYGKYNNPKTTTGKNTQPFSYNNESFYFA